jgi:crotonobetainyl-CoA:carnitine CoA-transferase CaiB-like acyl-CoA transferase
MAGGPLEGVRVVELCSAIAGPFAGKLLGDMGAEVVKVEPPESGAADRVRPLPYDTHGDPEFTWRFLNYNTSKESLGLDLKSEEGAAVLGRLLEDADVCLQNMRPGSMERLGFDWASLHERNPSLVYCSISGYGREGPYRSRPALDTLIQGISGFATQVGSGDRPETMEVLVVDMMTGLYAAWSIAAALFERGADGAGQRIDVSMLDVAVSMLGHQLAEYTGAQHDPDVEVRYGRAFAPNGFYEAADGYVAIFAPQDFWAAVCRAIDREEWTDPDHAYATNERRLESDRFREDLEAVLGERSVEAWLDRFAAVEGTVPAAPVNDIDEMVGDPQVQAQEAVVARDHPQMGEYYTPPVVPKFSRTPAGIEDAPALGSDTDRLLEELGYDAAERQALRERGIIE